jgi:hypothetical protein
MCLEELYYGTKYIPLAIDVSDQNVFLSNYNFLRQEICWGREVFFAWQLFCICFSCLELKFNLNFFPNFFHIFFNFFKKSQFVKKKL